MRVTVWIFALAWLLAATTQAENAILVLDASGSMWGQIEGRSKIEIAREVIAGLLAEVPPERRLGLVAYGHRREGDCADIEEIVPVGTDRAAILAKVNALKPRGKTPLTEGVRFAAKQLRYTDEPATVILVSDGAESCNADPCALGRELEATGAAFTTHVIGFGLASATESAGLRCLAEATGGRYIGADNAQQLASALSETVAAPPPPAPVAAPTTGRVILRATELAGGPEVQSGLAWRIAAADAEPVFSAEDAGTATAEVAPGRYVARVSRPADGLKGSAEFSLEAGMERTVTIALEFELAATLTLSPPDAAQAGSAVTVNWQGPDRKGDYITTVLPDALPSAYTHYAYTDSGNPLTLTMPVEPGDYEVRYVLGAPQRVVVAVPIKVVAAEATLEAPAQVAAGAPFPVTWSGPNAANDWITIIGTDAAVQAYGSYVDANRPSPVNLDAPIVPGSYELRYVAKSQKILARRPIEVTTVSASIEAPESVAAGASFEIRWQGPNNRADWLTIIAPAAGVSAYGSYVDAEHGSPATLSAPAAPGDYELRYVQKGTTVLARRAIRVTAP